MAPRPLADRPLVLTAAYMADRGTRRDQGCRHCPSVEAVER